MLCVLIIVGVPLFWILITSFKARPDIYTSPAVWWPLLTRVVLPMSGPTMVAFAVVTLVNEWNEYLWPFLMADDARVATLPVGLTLLQNTENPSTTNWGPVMAGTLLTMLPILVVF